MVSKILPTGETDIHYRVIGSGDPLLWIHGFGENSDIFDGIVPFFEKNYTCILPELPGSGRSGLTSDMSMEGLARLMAFLLEKENIQSATLIGHSMGGYATMAFAEIFPEKLKAMALFHSTAYADTEEKKETRKKGIQFIRNHGAFEFLKTATPNLFAPETRDQRPELIDQQIATLGNFSAASLVAYYEAMMARPDRRNILKISKVPVLFLAGEKDNAVPVADVLEQCHLPEISYIHILKRSGHMGMLEEPELCVKAIQEFLAHPSA